MARFGIPATFGNSIPQLRAVAKRIGRDHDMALALWATGVHEARILAAMVEDPKLVTEEQAEAWVSDFDSWDLCDQCCSNLLDRTPFAWRKIREWTAREEEFVRRAGYVLIAVLAVHDKSAPDSRFTELLPTIEGGATDPRNYVRKAVNWALRQVGKRDIVLNQAAIECGERLLLTGDRTARWVATDALRELRSPAVLERLSQRSTK